MFRERLASVSAAAGLRVSSRCARERNTCARPCRLRLAPVAISAITTAETPSATAACLLAGQGEAAEGCGPGLLRGQMRTAAAARAIAVTPGNRCIQSTLA